MSILVMSKSHLTKFVAVSWEGQEFLGKGHVSLLLKPGLTSL